MIAPILIETDGVSLDELVSITSPVRAPVVALTLKLRVNVVESPAATVALFLSIVTQLGNEMLEIVNDLFPRLATVNVLVNGVLVDHLPKLIVDELGSQVEYELSEIGINGIATEESLAMLIVPDASVVPVEVTVNN